MSFTLIKFRPNQDKYAPIVTSICTEDEIHLYEDDLDFAILMKFETDLFSLSVGVDEYLESK